MGPAVVVSVSHHWCKAHFPWVMQIKHQDLRLSVDIWYFRNSDATEWISERSVVFQSSFFCCIVWFSPPVEGKLSESLCNPPGSWAVCSEELRPEIMVYLMGSKKHSGGKYAQSKLAHQAGLEDLGSLQQPLPMLLNGVKLKCRYFLKFFLRYIFFKESG